MNALQDQRQHLGVSRSVNIARDSLDAATGVIERLLMPAKKDQ